MEPFAIAVDRLLAKEAVTPNQISERANNSLAGRGIRQPGGLASPNKEKFLLEALQIIFDAAAEERIRRKEIDQSALRTEMMAYLSAKYEPLRYYAASLASEQRTSIQSLANAKADQLLQLAAST